MDLKENESALIYCQKAAALNPESFEICLNLGVLLTLQKIYREGVVELREANRLRPDDPRPLQLIHRAEAVLQRGGK